MKKREKTDRRWDWFEDDEEIRLLQNGKRGVLAIVFGRATIILLLVLLEFAIIIFAAHRLGEYSSVFYLLSRLLSVAVIMYLINTSGNPTQKITWIVLIFAVPAVGLTLYLLVRLDLGHRAIKSRLQTIIAETAPLCPQNVPLMEKLRADAPSLRGLAAYAYRTASGTVYENNVVRFANYLHKLSDTQFIVITHRRGTMEASDRLYGITMQEKGVSTLVSVNLVEKELK